MFFMKQSKYLQILSLSYEYPNEKIWIYIKKQLLIFMWHTSYVFLIFTFLLHLRINILQSAVKWGLCYQCLVQFERFDNVTMRWWSTNWMNVIHLNGSCYFIVFWAKISICLSVFSTLLNNGLKHGFKFTIEVCKNFLKMFVFFNLIWLIVLK